MSERVSKVTLPWLVGHQPCLSFSPLNTHQEFLPEDEQLGMEALSRRAAKRVFRLDDGGTALIHRNAVHLGHHLRKIIDRPI